jgi:hypothetical protein
MTKIKVYMEDGRVFTYNVADRTKAREHAHRIVNYGWRVVVNGIMEYYTTHQVTKVTFGDPKDYLSKKYEGEFLPPTDSNDELLPPVDQVDN